jgi:hypothetical protein
VQHTGGLAAYLPHHLEENRYNVLSYNRSNQRMYSAQDKVVFATPHISSTRLPF